MPDAPELIEKFLANEANGPCKRNAFIMLCNCDQDRAIAYLASMLDSIAGAGESFQLLVLELIRKVCRLNPLAKSQYIHCIYTLVNLQSHAVSFEGVFCSNFCVLLALVLFLGSSGQHPSCPLCRPDGHAGRYHCVHTGTAL